LERLPEIWFWKFGLGRDLQAGKLMSTSPIEKRVAAEALGTLLLVATVVGSGIMAAKLSAGNAAVALLGNTLATGAMLIVLITIFGPLSGAHFNPVVSLVMHRRDGTQFATTAKYVAAQIVGGCMGTWFAHAMFDIPVFQISTTIRSGPAQWLSESVAVFGLLCVIFGCQRFRTDFIATAVGLYIVAAYWFTASTSFANPAVTIARALTDTFAGIAPGSVAPFIIAQGLGAGAASLLCGWLFAPTQEPR
jgi:glycerol uptake facilitator-like aquaporin